VSFESGAFATLGAVAMQGVRQAGPNVGERIGVIGIGLVGLLTCQVLKAAGCRVFAVDVDAARVERAMALGADQAIQRSDEALQKTAQGFTGGMGLDACIITAATVSSDPIELAGELTRDRGRVVVVGAVGMEVPRRPYYEKELELRLSRSYGPGRYDSSYEEKGVDYPPGYIRWTERRNMESFLELVAAGSIDVASLVTHRFPIDRALEAYEVVTGEAGEPSVAIALTYPEGDTPTVSRVSIGRSTPRVTSRVGSSVGIGLVGAGAFARSVLLPALARIPSAQLVGVASSTGPKAKQTAARWGFRYCTGDYRELLDDEAVGAVIIATPHHLHAGQVVEAMRAGKDVFVEKPLALAADQLQEVVAAREETGRRIMVGFNRRFSRAAQVVREFLSDVSGPLAAHYRVNAGPAPAGHWLTDPDRGGGRVLGEVCHFIDFVQFLGRNPVVQVSARQLFDDSDSVEVLVELADGSHGSILYVAEGSAAFSKERIECFGGGKAAVIDDFRRVELAGSTRVRRPRRWKKDKGHARELKSFLRAIQEGTEAPIPFEEIVSTTLATLAANDSLSTGCPVRVEVLGEPGGP
jgi:polar amino acid transport system substrate-binding protein